VRREPELGAGLPGQRIRTRATRPPIDPRLLRSDPSVRWLVAGTGLLAAVVAAALIAQATALAAIVASTFLDGVALAEHRGWLVLLVTAVVTRAGATWLTDVLAQRTAARVKSRLRAAVIDRLTRRGPGEEAATTGELAGALTEGIDALDGTFRGYLPALVAGAVVPLAIVAWLLRVELTSAITLAVTLPLIPLFMVLIGLAARAATRRRFRALTELSGHLLAVLQGLTTIRVVRATDRIGAVVRDAGERLRRTTLETLRVAFVSALALELLAALAVATVAVLAGVRLAQGTGVAFEPVLVALLLAPEAFFPLRRVGQQFHANEDGAAAAERLFDLLGPDPVAGGVDAEAPVDVEAPVGVEAPAVRAPSSGPHVPRRPAPDPAEVPLRLQGVTVTYPDRPLPALDRVELTVRPGEQLAVLGASGAGKSTLGAVLLGLRRPDVGRVAVGNVEVADLDPDAWHQRLAWVPQSPADLAGTVRELVTLGRSASTSAREAEPTTLAAAATDTEVWAALAGVGLADEVSALPAGLDTRVGPGGRGLSAGQRRRLAIARAIVRPAGLVVLDEPTGDLDVEADQAVRGALADLSRRRTVVVLTHRVAVAAGADRVVVLDDGRVVEVGPPAELLARGGAYTALVAASRPLRPVEVAAAMTGPDVGAPAPPPAATADSATAPARPTDADRSTLAVLRQLLRPHRRPLLVAATAGAITPLAGVVLVAVSTYLISRAALQPNLLDLTVVIVAVRALSLLKGTSRYVERLAGHDVALRTVVDLRVHAYERLVPLAPAGLQRHRIGDVLTRVVSDVDRLQLALVRGVVPLLGGAVASAVVVLLAGLLLPAAAAVVAVGLVLAAVGVPALSARLAHRPERDLARARGQLTAELVDVLQAAPELRLLGRLGPARRHLDALDAEVTRLDRSAVARGGGADALVQLALGLTAVGLVLVGVPAVTSGALDGVLLGALVVLALGAMEAVGPLPASAQALVTAASAARRLRQVLDAPPPAPDPNAAGGPAEATPRHRHLVVDAATARYPEAPTPAVHELDLVVAPGRRIAVVGRSGAGKSTLANLTVRFLDPEAGEVRLDGTALTAMAGDDVRGVVALAPQDAHVFAGTLADNLRLAAPDADDGALHTALAAAHLDRWVAELPDGLATAVGERGSRLSGGQRHRLALARTLLTGAPLVVYDEPTADLDPITGRAFLADALRAAGDRGVVVLTHDLRVLPVVDEVVVLEAGRIIARGRHEDLLRADAVYAARWRLELAAVS
jgi:ATP-binding cassette, subfamily C, bacterial CydCD